MVLKKLTQDYNSHSLLVNIAIFRDNIFHWWEATLVLVIPYTFVIMMASPSKKLPNTLSQLFAEISYVKSSTDLGNRGVTSLLRKLVPPSVFPATLTDVCSLFILINYVGNSAWIHSVRVFFLFNPFYNFWLVHVDEAFLDLLSHFLPLKPCWD